MELNLTGPNTPSILRKTPKKDSSFCAEKAKTPVVNFNLMSLDGSEGSSSREDLLLENSNVNNIQTLHVLEKTPIKSATKSEKASTAKKSSNGKNKDDYINKLKEDRDRFKEERNRLKAAWLKLESDMAKMQFHVEGLNQAVPPLEIAVKRNEVLEMQNGDAVTHNPNGCSISFGNPEIKGKGTGDTHCEFQMILTYGDKHYVYSRRYTEFDTFRMRVNDAAWGQVKNQSSFFASCYGGNDKTLKMAYDSLMQLSFPSWKFFGNLREDFLLERNAALEEYMRGVIKIAQRAGRASHIRRVLSDWFDLTKAESELMWRDDRILPISKRDF